MAGVRSGGGKDKPGGACGAASGTARPRKRKLRPCPPDVVRVPAGTDLDVAARVRGVDFFWVDFEEDGSALLWFPGVAR